MKVINITIKIFGAILFFGSIAAIIVLGLTRCANKKDAPEPVQSITQQLSASDTLVKFTLYSKRVPYIWKRVVNNNWVEDTIKTNGAVRYEPFDSANFGYGYWATMNLAGLPTDSLHIIGQYKNKTTQMASPKYQSAAYVLLDDLK
jgi:hypothetical protein